MTANRRGGPDERDIPRARPARHAATAAQSDETAPALTRDIRVRRGAETDETAMLDRVTARFDALYSPTALAADRQPPAGTARVLRATSSASSAAR